MDNLNFTHMIINDVSVGKSCLYYFLWANLHDRRGCIVLELEVIIGAHLITSWRRVITEAGLIVEEGQLSRVTGYCDYTIINDGFALHYSLGVSQLYATSLQWS